MAKKVQIWSEEITEIDDWNKYINSDKLIILEIYSKCFGSCEAYVPSIDKIMKKIEQSNSKLINDIKWIKINMTIMNERVNEFNETQNEKNENKNNNNSDTNNDDNKNNDNNNENENENENDTENENNNNNSKNINNIDNSQGNVLGLIDKYLNFVSPIPFYLFIKSKNILGILRECDENKLKTYVDQALNGDKITINNDEIQLINNIENQTADELEAELKKSITNNDDTNKENETNNDNNQESTNNDNNDDNSSKNNTTNNDETIKEQESNEEKNDSDEKNDIETSS